MDFKSHWLKYCQDGNFRLNSANSATILAPPHMSPHWFYTDGKTAE